MPLLLKLYLHEISGGKKGQSKEVYLINFILFLFICLLTSGLSIFSKECDINRILINQEVIMTIYLANYATIELEWNIFNLSLSLSLSLNYCFLSPMNKPSTVRTHLLYQLQALSLSVCECLFSIGEFQ